MSLTFQGTVLTSQRRKMMRNWLCKLFYLVPKEKYLELYREYTVQLKDFNVVVNKFQMQNAWEQMKQEKQSNKRRIH